MVWIALPEPKALDRGIGSKKTRWPQRDGEQDSKNAPHGLGKLASRILSTIQRPPPAIQDNHTRALQFTKRRNRTLFTSPSIKNTDRRLEPPLLISGKGMPVTGIRPTTIPMFTNR